MTNSDQESSSDDGADSTEALSDITITAKMADPEVLTAELADHREVAEFEVNDGGRFVEEINEFESGFQYPEDIHNDPEFWLEHVHQQIDEAEESYAEGDLEHMVVEFGDAILVCWRAMQIFGEEPPEKILSDRMDLNLDEKGYESIMQKYTEWWRSVKAEREAGSA